MRDHHWEKELRLISLLIVQLVYTVLLIVSEIFDIQYVYFLTHKTSPFLLKFNLIVFCRSSGVNTTAMSSRM